MPGRTRSSTWTKGEEKGEERNGEGVGEKEVWRKRGDLKERGKGREGRRGWPHMQLQLLDPPVDLVKNL